MAHHKTKTCILTILIFNFNIGNSQKALPTIACICELEALIIQSKETDKELILEETENGLTYEFVSKNIEVPKQELILENVEKEEKVIPVEKPLENTKQKVRSKKRLKKRKVKSRKKRKARKVRLKKRKLKKYKGDCPRWR